MYWPWFTHKTRNQVLWFYYCFNDFWNDNFKLLSWKETFLTSSFLALLVACLYLTLTMFPCLYIDFNYTKWLQHWSVARFCNSCSYQDSWKMSQWHEYNHVRVWNRPLEFDNGIRYKFFFIIIMIIMIILCRTLYAQETQIKRILM